jgi:hypothetical protein
MQQELACTNTYAKHNNRTTRLLAAKLLIGHSIQFVSLCYEMSRNKLPQDFTEDSLPLHVHRLLLQAQ